MSRHRPFDIVCATLAARLAGGALGGMPAHAIEKGEVDWSGIVRVSGLHLMTPALAASLEDLGLAGRLPDDLAGYLAFMRARNADRNRALREELLEIVGALNDAGIEPLLLKGAARLFDGLYPDDSWRFMCDLDLLVPEPALVEASRVLSALGYVARPGETDGRAEGQPHLPGVYHPDREGDVELHAHLLRPEHRAVLPAEDVLGRSALVRAGDRRFRVPHAVDQIVYVIAHAQLKHGYRFTGRMILRDLVELHLLHRRCGTSATSQAFDRLAKGGHAAAAGAMLALTGVLFEGRPSAIAEHGRLAALMARRALLQQRSRVAMAALAPAGFALQRVVEAAHLPGGLARLGRALLDPAWWAAECERLRVFRGKTSW